MAKYSTILEQLQEKKNRGLMLAASFARLGEMRQAELILSCGTFLGFGEDGEGVKLVEANFCKGRLCPACAWRRSLKIYAATSQILDYIDLTKPGKVKYLFLTLTVRNVKLEDLGKAISDMAEAYNRLRANRAWKRRVLGAMRTLEVTINRETREAHPHYHLILAVDRQYATRNDKTYWTHEDWLHAWQQAARLEYRPVVSIEKVRGRKSGIAEVSKYMAKDTDYLIDPTIAGCGTEEAEAWTDYLVGQLTKQLHGRRLISYTGILRDAQRALRLDPEEGPLTDTLRGDVSSAIKHFHWNAGLGNYQPGRGNGT